MLAHYSEDTKYIYDNSPDGVNIATAKKAIKLAEKAIKQLYLLTDGAYPAWLDWKEYRMIK